MPPGGEGFAAGGTRFIVGAGVALLNAQAKVQEAFGVLLLEWGELRWDMGVPADPCPGRSFAVAQSAIAPADRELVAPFTPQAGAVTCSNHWAGDGWPVWAGPGSSGSR
jgi:hypothetical protein